MNFAYSIHTVFDTSTSLVCKKKYELLFLSFMLLIFGDTFNHQLTLLICNILQNMVIGFVIFYQSKSLRLFILFPIFATLILSVFGSALRHYIDVKSWQGLVYLLYFLVITKEVYKEVIYGKTVNRELLAAVLCGFVLLCLIATFLFLLIETRYPNSFSNLGDKRSTLKNLNYFSFTTLLTIGFGDITPLSLIAKRAVMLIGLAGHFYTVFVTSIIIGKYLSSKNTSGNSL